jgi:hypothetical protein
VIAKKKTFPQPECRDGNVKQGQQRGGLQSGAFRADDEVAMAGRRRRSHGPAKAVSGCGDRSRRLADAATGRKCASCQSKYAPRP